MMTKECSTQEKFKPYENIAYRFVLVITTQLSIPNIVTVFTIKYTLLLQVYHFFSFKTPSA